MIGRKRDRLFDALRKNKARNPRVFGSVARRQATRQSDLDLIVDFDPEASIYDLVGLKIDLERVLHRKVDVVEPRGLHWLMRPQILFEATPL
ncbi:MAG TPA: nucleotidyltransferase domain-containing protein [Thermoplasmata archaeon]|nr:nucleotidyltransferase domain-containing protein [Thermoplasmata archaeon]